MRFLVDNSTDAEETVQCANCDQESNKKVNFNPFSESKHTMKGSFMLEPKKTTSFKTSEYHQTQENTFEKFLKKYSSSASPLRHFVCLCRILD